MCKCVRGCRTLLRLSALHTLTYSEKILCRRFALAVAKFRRLVMDWPFDWLRTGFDIGRMNTVYRKLVDVDKGIQARFQLIDAIEELRREMDQG